MLIYFLIEGIFIENIFYFKKLNLYNFMFLFCFFVVLVLFFCIVKDLNIKLKFEIGILVSYNYFLLFDDFVECIWFISVDINFKIILFFEFFNVFWISDCFEDYLEV